MNLAWTRSFKTEEEKQKFLNLLMAAKPALQRLTEILQEDEDDLDVRESDVTVYDAASWSHKQAHLNGHRACLRKIKRLVDLDQQQRKNTDGPKSVNRTV